MKKVVLFPILLLGFLTLGFGQSSKSVVLCEDYSTSGVPSGVYDSWDINADGGYVYVLYRNGSSKIKGELSLWVDKKDEDGYYTAWSTLDFDVDNSKTWAVYDYLLEEDGEYKFSVMDEKGNLLAETEATVQYKDGEEPSNNDDDEDEAVKEDESDDDDDDAFDKYDEDGNPTTWYYEDSYIEFAKNIDSDGIAEDASEEWSYSSGGTTLYILYTDEVEIKTDEVHVEIYGGKDYSELIEEYDVTVEPDWGWFKFKQTFKKKGNYSVSIYNEDDIFMNSGYLTIK